jgi:hypothetical protein
MLSFVRLEPQCHAQILTAIQRILGVLHAFPEDKQIGIRFVDRIGTGGHVAYKRPPLVV